MSSPLSTRPMHRNVMSRAIQDALTPEVRKYVWWRLKNYGHLHTVEQEELQQYLYIATWKALEGEAEPRLDPATAGQKIYNKLLDMLRNGGKDKLGLGLRKQNAKFWQKTLHGLDLEAGVRLADGAHNESPLDRVAWEMARDRLVESLKAMDSNKKGGQVREKLQAMKSERLTTLVVRSRRTFAPLVQQAAEEAGSPQEGVRLFQEAVEYFKYCA